MFARVLRRSMATASAGASPKRESTFMRVWAKEYAAYPIIIITCCAATFGIVKCVQAVAGPEYHFNRAERRTLDYLENNRDVSQIERWNEGTFRKGPEFIQDRSAYKRYEKVH